jgi:hypothetical protein
VLDSLPEAEPTGGTGLRTTALVLGVTVLGLAVLVLLAWVSGIFNGLRHTGNTLRGDDPAAAAPALICHPRPSVAAPPAAKGTPSGSAKAAASVKARPAPTPTATQGPVPHGSAPAAGAGSTPLDAAVLWRDSTPIHDVLVESKPYAPAGDAPAGARTIGWFDRSGSLLGLVTVVPQGPGWRTAEGQYCG